MKVYALLLAGLNTKIMKIIVGKSILAAMVILFLFAGGSQQMECKANEIEHFLTNYTNAIAKGDKKAAAYASTQVAEYLISENDYKPALNYLKQSKLLYLEINDTEKAILSCREMAFIYSILKDFETAISSFEEAYILSKKIANNDAMASNIFEIALLQNRLNKEKNAYKNLQKAIEYAEKGNNPTLQKQILIELISTAQTIRKTKEALEYQHQLRGIEDAIFEKVKNEQEKIIESIQDDKLKAEMKANLIQKSKEHELFLKEGLINELDQTISEKDSFLNQKEMHLQVAHQQNKEQQMHLDLLSKEKEIDALKLHEFEEKQKAFRSIIILISIIVALVSITAIVLYRSIVKQRASKKKIKLKNKEIRLQHQNIVHSINYAQRIQETILPRKSTLEKTVNNCMVFFKPRDIVSGDLYWFHPLENSFLIAAIDCTGHGVPGALVSMIAANSLNKIVSAGTTSPEKILDSLHIEIGKAFKQDSTENNDGMDICLCLYTPSTKQLLFAGAKNGLIHIQNDTYTYHKGDIMPIGGNSKRISANFKLNELQLNEGDKIYLFSDGFQDQFGGNDNRKFTRNKLAETLLDIRNTAPEEQKQTLEKTLNEWKGSQKQIDDILVLGFSA